MVIDSLESVSFSLLSLGVVRQAEVAEFKIFGLPEVLPLRALHWKRSNLIGRLLDPGFL